MVFNIKKREEKKMIKTIIAIAILVISYKERKNIKKFFVKIPHHQEVNNKSLIDELQISEKNKDNLKYYFSKKDEKNENRLFGMALALQDEGLIASKDFVSLVIKK